MKHLIIVLAFGALFLQSCKDEVPEVAAGNVAVNIYVKHHSIAIPNSKIFIKYNTLQFPGTDTTKYDSFVVTDGNGYYKLQNIGNGQKEMVLYAKGYDNNVSAPVWGYSPVFMETNPGESEEATVSIAVTE